MTSARTAVVVTGGWGPERDDFLPSARVVHECLVDNGWQAGLIDIRQAGDLDGMLDAAAAVDVTFLCHAEDLLTYKWLEDRGLRSTAPAPWTSIAGTYDKYLTYATARGCGVPVPAHRLVSSSSGVGFVPEVPCIVKPVSAGSSLGVSYVGEPGQFPAAARSAGAYGAQIMVEEFLAGQEFTVGAVGGRVIGALTIDSSPEPIYNYGVKHEAAVSFGAVELASAAGRQLADSTARLAEALRITGFWRADYRARGAEICLIDVNLLPFIGRFEGGMVAALLDAAHLSFYDFLEQLAAVSGAQSQSANTRPGER